MVFFATSAARIHCQGHLPFNGAPALLFVGHSPQHRHPQMLSLRVSQTYLHTNIPCCGHRNTNQGAWMLPTTCPKSLMQFRIQTNYSHFGDHRRTLPQPGNTTSFSAIPNHLETYTTRLANWYRKSTIPSLLPNTLLWHR